VVDCSDGRKDGGTEERVGRTALCRHKTHLNHEASASRLEIEGTGCVTSKRRCHGNYRRYVCSLASGDCDYCCKTKGAGFLISRLASFDVDVVEIMDVAIMVSGCELSECSEVFIVHRGYAFGGAHVQQCS
jgi:hypothetical protein